MLMLRRLAVTSVVACLLAAITIYLTSHLPAEEGSVTDLTSPAAGTEPGQQPGQQGDRAADAEQSETKRAVREEAPSKEIRPTPAPALMEQGDESDDVRDLQARLRQIDWFQADVTGFYGPVTTEAVSGFQDKREIPATGTVDQRTLDRLYAMTSEPTKAELTNQPPPVNGNAPGALDPRCTTGRALCVDKTSQTLRWVVDGEVRTTLDVRFGSELTPTREGLFGVTFKNRDHVSSIYDTSMPFAMFFSDGQAVHYSPDFASVGYAGASHGCVNVRDYAGIAALFDQVKVGDRVVVYRS